MSGEKESKWWTLASLASARVVLWTYAYFGFEWLFFVTKSSVVSTSGWGTRLLMLLIPPLVPIAVLVPVQCVLAKFETMRGRASRRWLMAVLPATLATLLLLIAIENFSRTVFSLGVVDVTGSKRWVFFLACAVAWMILVTIEARRPVAFDSPQKLVVASALLVVLGGLAAALFVLQERRASTLLTAPDGESQMSKPRFNVLLLGIDGVSAERTSVYGYDRDTTPFLADLGSHATVFENAFSNSGVTCGSLISLLTGRRPTETQVFQCPVYLDEPLSSEHLPAILRREGYAAAQIGLRDHADAGDWNMRGAFQEVNGRTLDEEPMRVARSSTFDRVKRFYEEVVERIAVRAMHLAGIRPIEDTYRFLSGASTNASFSDRTRMRLANDFIVARREPWFLHMHLIDTHCCEWGFAPHRFSKPAVVQDQKWRSDRADDALWQIDRYIAELIDTLRETGQLERTVIIIFSDHSMGWSTVERIPLIISVPGQDRGQRIRENVELLDVGPTILDILKLERPRWMEGRSLMNAAELVEEHPVYALWDSWRTGRPAPLARGPFNGASSASIVLCNQWVELALDGEPRRDGRVAGHTEPCSDATLEERARALLTRHLAANGYPISNVEPPHSRP